SYRALATTANTFGRESFMDELAALAGQDPLEFRLAHLDNPRLRAVLEEAARRFDWPSRSKPTEPGKGAGLDCAFDKGGYVAACASVSLEKQKGASRVERVGKLFECCKIIIPGYLASQSQGAIPMGLGAALRASIESEDGVIQNAACGEYRAPRFAALPT